MLDFYAFFILCGVRELTFLTLVSLLGPHAWFLCLFYSMRGAWAYLSDSGISIRRQCLISMPFYSMRVRELTFLTLVSILGAHAWFLYLFYSMPDFWAYLSDSGISIWRQCLISMPFLFYAGVWAYLSDSGISIRRSCLISIPFVILCDSMSLPFWL